jgi:hypothetical protein
MKTLENIKLKATNSMPAVSFDTSGKLKIGGKIIPENAHIFFDPLFRWIESLDSEDVVFDINLDYMNTSASMLLFGLLQKLEDNSYLSDIRVNWHYEEEDEDHYETGLMFEEQLSRTKFNYLSFI